MNIVYHHAREDFEIMAAPARNISKPRVPAKNIKEQFKRWQKRTLEPGLTALLIVEILLFFVALPLEANNHIPSVILTMMVGLFLIASFIVALQSRLAIAAFAAAAILSQIYSTHYSTLTAWFDAGARHTAICAVSWVIAKMVFGSGRVSIHRIEAAIVLYLNIALLFFTTYQFVLTVFPDAFLGLTLKLGQSQVTSDLLYFSFATMMSTGYAGITPVSALARNLVGIQSLIGLLYPAVLLIWFVMLQTKQSDSLP
jgi:hypothetical protein